MPAGRDLNQLVSRIFGPTLIVTGIAGFVVPPKKAMTSGAPAYNVFHLIFGVVGLLASRYPDAAAALALRSVRRDGNLAEAMVTAKD